MPARVAPANTTASVDAPASAGAGGAHATRPLRPRLLQRRPGAGLLCSEPPRCALRKRCPSTEKPVTMLAPMSPAEFASFAEEAVASYAHDNMISGRASQADAERIARQSFARLLPDGLGTAGHHLYTIRAGGAGGAAAGAADSAGNAGSVVGSLWFAVVDGVEGRSGYIYNIRIEPPYRGRGHAKEALDLVEAVALRLGLDAIALHVFGFNTNAQALYRSQGYGITGMNMRKTLRR